ncbi:MAG: 3-hydroxyacyl-CoA dehydrogenase NAD-binding domain-containing protein [Candidatus Hermodarchaeota archaeon]
MDSLQQIKIVSVIGAGTMGREIAQVALMSNLFDKVYLNDIDGKILDIASKFIKEGLIKIEKKGKLAQGLTSSDLMEKLILNTNLYDSIRNSDFIFEAIPEIMQLKQKLFKVLSENSPPQTILATNTSTMSITKIAEATNRPESIVGMHFFTPIPVLRLIEVIKGKHTADEVFETAVSLGQALPALKGKRYIAKIEKESPGFIVNRLTIAGGLFLNWILDKAVEENIPIEEIDNNYANPPGLGPFAKWDYLGLDVVSNACKYFEEKVSPQFKPGKVLSSLVKEGNLGKKTGKGIYEWENGMPKLKTTKKLNFYNIEYYFAIQLNEGCRLLEEGIVKNYKIIDDTMLAGMDMPGPFGPGKNNYKRWSEMLEELVKTTGLTYFKPCNLMKSGDFLTMRK